MGQEDRRSRRVYPRMWRAGSFSRLSPIPPSGQSLWLYLLTCPESSHLPGAIVSGKAAMAELLHWEQPDFDRCFAELVREHMAVADWRSHLIWLPAGMRLNPPGSPNVLRGWGKHHAALPACRLKTVIYDEIEVYAKGLGPGFWGAFFEAFQGGGKAAALVSPGLFDNQAQPPETATGDGVIVTAAQGTSATAADSEIDRFFSGWAARGFGAVLTITPKRRAAARAIRDKLGPGSLLRLIDEVSASPGLQGQNQHGWHPDVAWILRPDNAVRVLEGGFRSWGVPKATGELAAGTGGPTPQEWAAEHVRGLVEELPRHAVNGAAAEPWARLTAWLTAEVRSRTDPAAIITALGEREEALLNELADTLPDDVVAKATRRAKDERSRAAQRRAAARAYYHLPSMS